MNTIPLWLDLAAVAVGALGGAVFAAKQTGKHEIDVFGGFVLAVVAALGGGMMRDIMLNVPLAALNNNAYLLVALLAGGCGLLFTHIFEKAGKVLLILDSIALSLFVLVGVQKAVSVGLDIIPSILVGTITGVGGGILRDLLAGHKPQVMAKSTFYAVAAVAGASTFVLMKRVGFDDIYCGFTTIYMVNAVRYLSVKRNIHTPLAARLTLKRLKR